VQRYRECERNAGVQWSINFNPHPRAWHIVSDDITYAGSEMNVDTDEFLKSLKSLQVSRCGCSAKNPDPDYPTTCPRFQTMHGWCPPATGPGQPHLSGCSHYSRPVPFQFSVKHHPATPATLDKKYVDLNVDLKLPMKSGPFGHGMKYAVQQPLYQAQAYAAALSWMEKQNTAPITPGCTCAAKLVVIGHAAFCPL
jgi:hypothetical protein